MKISNCDRKSATTDVVTVIPVASCFPTDFVKDALELTVATRVLVTLRRIVAVVVTVACIAFRNARCATIDAVVVTVAVRRRVVCFTIVAATVIVPVSLNPT